MMLNVINTIALTLLVALVCVIPGTLLGQYIPAVFHPSLQQMAVAAWLSALISWWVARFVCRKQIEAAHQAEAMQQKMQAASKPRVLAITAVFLAVAVGVAAVFHFFGDGLLT